MSEDQWFVCKVKDFKAKKNTNINNLANLFSNNIIELENFFDIPERSEIHPLFMCYRLYSMFDPENKGYISLKSIEEWAKSQYNKLSLEQDNNTDSKDTTKYKILTQRVCNSIETYKNNYNYNRRIREGIDDENDIVETENIPITINEFINFCSPLFEGIVNLDTGKNTCGLSKERSVHFRTFTESNIALTNYFGTMTNIDPSGKFIPCTISPSSYLEPTAISVSRGEVSRPLKNQVFYITDSNLYHSSLWSPCKYGISASLLAWTKEMEIDKYDK